MAAIRSDIEIPSHGEKLAGWHYPSPQFDAVNKGPALVLAHGLGSIKEMRLDVYAAKFNSLGYTCVVFDYRCHGGSTGVPRALVDFQWQREDWQAAVGYTRSLEAVDPERVALFGTSLSGGHVIQVGAGDSRIAAIISQCPFTDGFRSGLTLGVRPLPTMISLGIRDLLFSSNEKTTNVSLTGTPGQAALMNAPDVIDGYTALLPAGKSFAQTVPARVGLKILLERPGAYCSKVKCPILFSICGKDTVAPIGPTRFYAKKAPKGVIRFYDDMGHFSIYMGDDYERAIKDYVDFLKANLPV